MTRLMTNAGRAGTDGSDQQLEADVMRFVAIIALCIVAISTLVEDAAPRVSASPDEPANVPVATAPRVPSPPMVAAPPASPPESASARAGGAVAITSESTARPRMASSAPRRPAAMEQRPAVAEPVRPAPIESHEAVADVAPPDAATASVDVEQAGQTATDPMRAEPAVAATTVTDESTIEWTAPESAPVAEVADEASGLEPSRAGQGAAAPPAAEPASPVEPPPASPTDEQGFTLRFASDAALLRLVGRGEAGLYVFDDGATLRLDYGPDGAAFAPAPGPGQYHEIAAATVPDLLRRTLARRDRRATDVVWGVTLPSATRAALARLISDHRSGELVIDERGRVRLETHHDRT